MRLLSSAATFDPPADADDDGDIHGPTSCSLFLEATAHSLTFDTSVLFQGRAFIGLASATVRFVVGFWLRRDQQVKSPL